MNNLAWKRIFCQHAVYFPPYDMPESDSVLRAPITCGNAHYIPHVILYGHQRHKTIYRTRYPVSLIAISSKCGTVSMRKFLICHSLRLWTLIAIRYDFVFYHRCTGADAVMRIWSSYVMGTPEVLHTTMMMMWLRVLYIQEWWDTQCQDTVCLVTPWTRLHAWNRMEKVNSKILRDC